MQIYANIFDSVFWRVKFSFRFKKSAKAFSPYTYVLAAPYYCITLAVAFKCSNHIRATLLNRLLIVFYSFFFGVFFFFNIDNRE